MADPIFEHPRLVAIYDAFDGPRADLEAYVVLARELGARSVLDIGSGTGCLAARLCEEGFEVIGLEPAAASLALARRKPSARPARWIHGDPSALPALNVDLAVMTGNVAQVFVTDEEWQATLAAARRAIRPGGHLVFEARDPARKAWLEWTPEKTRQREEIPGVGPVEGWCEVIAVEGERVHFRWSYAFASDGEVLVSDSVLRFRGREAIEASLRAAGYSVREVREAPDRPGKEFVFVAERP